MEFKKFVHRNVAKNGVCKSGGVVHTNGFCLLVDSVRNPFLTVEMPRDNNGVVVAIHVRFKSKKEMKEVLMLT